MITRALVAVLFALGMLFGGTLAAEQPAQPEAPAPVRGVEPADPDDPNVPTEPDDPIVDGSVEPADPEDPADPVEPGQPGEPGEPIEPIDPDEPIVDPDEALPDMPTDDFFTLLTANPELSAFAQAFEAAGIEQELRQLDPTAEWTIFAPADSVVFDPTALDAQGAMATYIVEGAYTYEDLRQAAEEGGGIATLTTMDGQAITVEIIGDTLLVAGIAQITQEDIQATAGYIHVIDAVIQPTPAPVGG